MTIFWDDLHETLLPFLSEASDHAYILTPFIQEDVLRLVLPAGVPTTVVTSWRVEHLTAGVSSLGAYGVCQEHGQVGFYIHPRIHLKIYGRDVTRASGALMFGSANLTRRGMGLAPSPNREILYRTGSASLRDRVQIQRLIAEADLVDEDTYKAYETWFDMLDPAIVRDRGPAPPPPPIPTPDRFLVTDLPLTKSPARLWELMSSEGRNPEWWEEDAAVHDMALYGGGLTSKERFFRETRAQFLGSPFISAFLGSIDEEGMYFGRIKEWVQQHCDDVPTPRRRELTDTVQALLRWVVGLEPGVFQVVRPSHSECLRRRAVEPEE